MCCLTCDEDKTAEHRLHLELRSLFILLALIYGHFRGEEAESMFKKSLVSLPLKLCLLLVFLNMFVFVSLQLLADWFTTLLTVL